MEIPEQHKLHLEATVSRHLGKLLRIKDTVYQLVELEYYYYSEQHPDPYVHCDDEQQNCDTFYFHRINNKGFKEGTYKGMDITFGTPGMAHGGLLVRAIAEVESGRIIEGPCLVVNEILSHFGFEKVRDFYESYSGANPSLSISNTESGMCLTTGDGPCSQNHVHYSPRVGLKLKGEGDLLKEKIQYVMRPYRATLVPTALKKQPVTIKLQDGPAPSGRPTRSLEQLASVKSWTVKDITELYNEAVRHCASA